MGRIVVCLPDGTQEIEDYRTLEDARDEAAARAKAAYAAQIAAGMEWQGHPLQIDQGAVSNISNVMLQVIAQVPLHPSFAWRMADNTFLPMDAAGVTAMATAAAYRVQELRVAMWAAVDAARNAQTIEEADAVAPIITVEPAPLAAAIE